MCTCNDDDDVMKTFLFRLMMIVMMTMMTLTMMKKTMMRMMRKVVHTGEKLSKEIVPRRDYQLSD